MKVTPVSADLLIKIALGALVVGGLIYAVAKAKKAVTDTVNHTAGAAWNGVVSTLNQVNPLNNDNIIYQTANTITGGSKDNPLGGRIYDAGQAVHDFVFPKTPSITYAQPEIGQIGNTDGVNYSYF